MWQDLSITRKFGLLFLVLVVFLTAIGSVVLSHVGAMRRDADRLLEETREHAIAQRMMGRLSIIESLSIEDALVHNGNELRRQMASEQVDALFTSLSSLHKPLSDPSRLEHQAEEDTLIDAAIKALEELRQAVVDPAESRHLSTSNEQLKAVRSCIVYFVEETRRELEFSDGDLEKSAQAARQVMASAGVAIAVVLCLALVLVYRTIIAPVRRLREGADRFGSGDLDFRIDLPRRDELGRLATSFNLMAGRIGQTQGSLEERIVDRTRELIRAGRLADIGILAAGVAHEINTPLASIAACAEGLGRLSVKGELSDSELKEYLETIASEAYRAHNITQQLLALSKQEHGKLVEIDLAMVLNQVEKTVAPLLSRRQVDMECSYLIGDIEMYANAGEMIQILVNLILNAKDASPSGGTIKLSCRAISDNLVFEVQDRGCGIAPENVERVFSPFYTTKGPGEGTGLGLSLVANLVEIRGGRISVTSTKELGTCFRVELPMAWRHEV